MSNSLRNAALNRLALENVSVTSLNGLTGDIDLTSPDSSISIVVNGQDIELEAIGSPLTGPASGDLSGYYPGPNVKKIANNLLGDTSQVAGNVLFSNGTEWITKTITGDVKIEADGSTVIGVGKVTNSMLAGSIAASKLIGSDIATVGTITTGTWNGTKISEVYGGTNQNSYTLGDTLYASAPNTLSKLSGNIATTKKFLSQTGNGSISAAPVWDTVTSGDIPGAPLTKTDDTNVTLTLGGSPSTALLNATSLTLGWSGLLSIARGGNNIGSQTTNGILFNNGTANITSANLTYSGGNISTTGTVISKVSKMVYVSALNGSDSTGNGGAGAPYATIAYALSQITTASTSNPFCIFLDGGAFAETSLILKPNVSIQGNGSLVSVNTNITLDSTFLTNASTSFIKDIVFAIGSNSLLFTVTTKSSVLTVFTLENINCASGNSFTITASSHADTSTHPTFIITKDCFWDSAGIGVASTRAITTTNCDVSIVNCSYYTVSIQNTSSTLGGDSFCYINGGHFLTSLTLLASGSRTLTSRIGGMATMPPTWTIDGANSSVLMYTPYNVAPTLANSATFAPASLFSGVVKTTNTTASSSTTTGALISSGGLGVAGNTFIGGNINVAGTATLSALTAGSIPFIGTGGLISQSNSRVFWDNTNFRLGINTNTPGFAIEAVGGVAATIAGPVSTQKQIVMSYDSANNRGVLTSIQQGTAFTPIYMECNNVIIMNGSTPITPTGGYTLYVLSGALKGKGSSGTVTSIGNADPHCKKCGSDFSVGWDNPRYGGEFVVCKICETEFLDNLRKTLSFIANNDKAGIDGMKDFLSTEISHATWNAYKDNDPYENVRIPVNLREEIANRMVT